MRKNVLVTPKNHIRHLKSKFSLALTLTQSALALVLATSMVSPAQAQSSLPTFTCEADAYNFFGNPSNVQRFDPASLSVLSTIPTSPSVAVNGIGFNPLDNYIYGVITNANGQAGFAGRDFARVGVDGSVESLGQVQPATSGLPAFSTVTTATGTMDASGNWYGISANHIFTVNVGNDPAAGTLTYTAVPRTGNNTVVFDIAFSPSDGLLYGSRNALVRMDPATGASAIVSTTGANPPSAGGAWSTSDGTLYFYNNGGGVLYSVDVTQPTPVVTNLGSVPSNGTFDSAACLPPTITKGIIGTGPDADGNFSYEFTISNAFTSPIFVNFGDPLPAGLTYIPGSISPASPGGGTVTDFTATNLDIAGLEIPAVGSLVFQVSVSLDPSIAGGAAIENQAVIEFGGATIPSDDPGTGAAGDGTVLTIPAMPSLSLVKSNPTNDDEDATTTVTIGDTLNYTITATNDGNVALTNVVVSDPLLNAPNDTITCSSLAIGATCELVGTYSVAAADLTAGMVENTASVESNEVTTPVLASVSTPVEPAPPADLSITKAADSTGPHAPGDVVTYTYNIENIGNISVTDVTVSDTHNGFAPLGPITLGTLTNTSGASSDDGVDALVDVLAPGDLIEFTAEYIVTATDVISGGPVTNTAVADGTTSAGSYTSPTASESISLSGTPRPALAPGVCGSYAREGFLIIPGTGRTELNADFGSGAPGLTPFDPYVVEPLIGRNSSTGVVSFYQTSADDTSTGSFLSNGTALSGADQLTSALASDPNPESEIWRLAARVDGVPGTTETLTIQNTGAHEHTAYWQTDINGAIINSDSSSVAGHDDGWLFGAAATVTGSEGTSYTIDVTYPADGIVILQFALLDSTGGFGGIIFDGYECPAPSLSMTKVADSEGPHTVGDVITYTYTVSNDGNQIIKDIAIADTHNGSDPAPTPGNETLLTDAAPTGDSTDAGTDNSWDVLAPGDAVVFTGTYTVTSTDVVALQ